MKDKTMMVMLVLAIVVISSLVTQMTAKPAKANYDVGNITGTPYSLLVINSSRGPIYRLFDHQKGEISIVKGPDGIPSLDFGPGSNYEIVTTKKYDGLTLYYAFDKTSGIVTEISNPENVSSQLYSYTLTEIPTSPYKIIPNAKGGCFVLNPDTGETYQIDTKGRSKKVLTPDSSVVLSAEEK